MSSGTVPLDHNGTSGTLTDEKMKVLHDRHSERLEDLDERQASLSAEYKELGRIVKADLGTHAYAAMKKALKAKTPEGAKKIKGQLEADLNALRWNGLPIGHIDDLFPERKEDRREAAKKLGRIAGLTGRDAKPPFSAGTEEGQLWMDAWHAGQAELAGGIKQKPPEPDFEDAPKAEQPVGDAENVDAGAQAIDKPVDLASRRRGRSATKAAAQSETAAAEREPVTAGIEEF